MIVSSFVVVISLDISNSKNVTAEITSYSFIYDGSRITSFTVKYTVTDLDIDFKKLTFHTKVPKNTLHVYYIKSLQPTIIGENSLTFYINFDLPMFFYMTMTYSVGIFQIQKSSEFLGVNPFAI